MADEDIDSERFILFDNWPWAPFDDTVPPDGFLGSSHHNVADPAYALGHKITVQNDSDIAGVAGTSIFIYLKGRSHTEANPTCAAKHVCVPSLAGEPYAVTNDPDQSLMKTGCPMVAIMLSVMTFTHAVTKYGWFWCGGVCPEGHVSDLGGNYVTNGDVVIGPIAAADLTTPDTIGLGNAAGQEAHIGCSYAADV